MLTLPREIVTYHLLKSRGFCMKSLETPEAFALVRKFTINSFFLLCLQFEVGKILSVNYTKNQSQK